MTFISNIKELKGFLKKGPAKNKSRIEAVIQLYEAKKIPNFKTALNMVLSLTFPSIYNPAKDRCSISEADIKVQQRDPYHK